MLKRIDKAFELIDAYNQKDPNKVSWGGSSLPAEYFYSVKVYEWVCKLDPEADEPLLLASRAQHTGRWEIPRDSYPMNKAGYLNWRSYLAHYHAEKASELLRQAGYNETEIENTKRIILKKDIKTDAQVQTIENALCLVFLQFQFEDFMSKHEEEKIVRILKKTWNKMSDRGREAALSLNYSEKALKLIKQALQG